MRVLISAGEASGELYGAELIRALCRRVPHAEFFGLGGPRMREAGCETLVDAREVAVVGLVEVVKHLPHILGRLNHLVRAAEQRRPEVAVLIDFPDFNFRLARRLHALGIPIVYYVSPQLWAWRRGRVKLVERYVRKMLVIFPFEEEFYRQHEVKVEFVGHPLADLPRPTITREEFAAQTGLEARKQWIGLLPGSRRKELSLNLPAMLGAAALLEAGEPGRFQFVLPVASTLDPAWVRAQLQQLRPAVHLASDVRATLAHCRAAIVASGTATVETALIGTPFVMVYRVAPLTYALGRHLVDVPHYGMVNLIADERVVPELIQGDFTPARVVEEVSKILEDGLERAKMLADLARVSARLEGTHAPGQTASDRAAVAVLDATGTQQAAQFD